MYKGIKQITLAIESVCRPAPDEDVAPDIWDVVSLGETLTMSETEPFDLHVKVLEVHAISSHVFCSFVWIIHGMVITCCVGDFYRRCTGHLFSRRLRMHQADVDI